MKRGACGRAVALLGALLLIACQSPLDRRRSVGRSAYLDALAVLAADEAAGRSALGTFLQANPNSLYADDAALRLAELALAEGRTDEARRHLEWAVQHHSTGDKSDAIRLELAGLELDAGENEAAVRTAEAIRISLLDGERRRRAHVLRAAVARANGDSDEELRWLGRVRADQDEPEETARVEARIDELLAGLDAEALEQAGQSLGRRQPAGRLWLHRAERALAEGNRSAAHAAFARAERLPLTPPEAGRLAHLKARLAGTHTTGVDELPGWTQADGSGSWALPAEAATLGVVLPLSGPYAEFGREALQGVLMATGLFDEGRPAASSLRLLVRDSGGDSERAAAGVAELAANPEVIACIGPLLGASAQAAAPVAEEQGLPLVTLTRSESVAALGFHVLRVGATPRLEVERVAAYAAETLGLRRFAILYPDDATGRAQRAAFWNAVEAHGGQIVGVGRYASDATDFRDPIRRLIGFEFLTGGQQRALAERARLRKRAKRLPAEEAAELRIEANELLSPDGAPLPPFVDFEALFIPDAHENVALIAPHLAFHEVLGVRLLGTAGWNHPDLIDIGGQHVDGAVFAAPFFAASESPFTAEFTRRFVSTFDAQPGVLAAQAFDAAHLVSMQITRGSLGREAVLNGLLRAKGVVGASGVLSMGADGSALRRPNLLGVERGEIISVDETGVAPYLRMPEAETDEAFDPAA
ncbi:MAG: penicillin-binding protein activator [Deltaproteobacteria bacterium]|nr:penicillin-binding protein activator [Deltaproteobacteria bacterium]